MVNFDENSPQSRNIVMIKMQLLLDHFKNAILKWSPPIFILHENQMVFCAFYVQHVWLSALVAVQTGMFGQLINFLLGYDNGIFEVQAGEINVLKGVVLPINLIKNLPRHIKLNPLPHHFHLIFILILEIRAFLELKRVVLISKLLIKSSFTLLHLLVEYLIILLADILMQILLLHGNVQLAHVSKG